MFPDGSFVKERALSIIEKSSLKHPDPSLLQSFLDGAVDKELAASYFLQKCSSSSTGIQQFLCEWKSLISGFANPSGRKTPDLERQIILRDGNRCCISQERGYFSGGLVVSPIISPPALRIEKDDPRYELLGAFLTPSERDKLLSMVEPHNLKEVQNHWLLSKAAFYAFHGGEIKIDTRFTSEEETNSFELDEDVIHPESKFLELLNRKDIRHVILDDKSRSGLEVPNHYLFTVHYRFAPALRWFKIAETLALRSENTTRIRNPPLPQGKFQFLKNVLHTTWLKVPQLLRLQVYKILASWGARVFRPTGDFGVQRLPFDMYLKHGPANYGRKHVGEFRALQIIREQTSIPVPRPIDLIQTPTDSYLIQSRIPGHIVGKCIDLCSEADTDQMIDDLQHYVNEMRSIPNPFAKKYAICNSLGAACMDWRIIGQYAGPFESEAEFSESLRLGIAPDLVHRSDHQIVFTHGDINMRNVIMENGRISGIIDWECSGWYPAYWDLCKCHWTTKHHRRWLKMVDRVFGDYQEELEIEREYQNLAPPW